MLFFFFPNVNQQELLIRDHHYIIICLWMAHVSGVITWTWTKVLLKKLFWSPEIDALNIRREC